MSKARLIITAVIVEGRSQADVDREYGLSQAWVSRLVARYRVEGDTAYVPRSRRPHTRPNATPASTVDLIIGLRRRLATDGLDAGADTIAWHLNEFRVRHDRVHSGSVSLRVDSQLHHIGLGQPLNGTRIIMLIHGYKVRVIHATTGEVIRQLTIDPQRRYHGTGAKIGGPNRPYGPRKSKKPEP